MTLPLAHIPRPVWLTTNWQDVGSASKTNFTYYDDTGFRVQRIHPVGGPAAGGTKVYVYLFDDRLLVNLGGEGTWGPRCRFSGRSDRYQRDVRAELVNCNGTRGCGAGWKAMSCTLPKWKAWVPGQVNASIYVEVSINGQQFSSGGLVYDEQYFPPVLFTLYDENQTWVDKISPHAGSAAGGTLMTIFGSGFTDFGDALCRFLPSYVVTNASIASSNQLRCLSPAQQSGSPAQMRSDVLQITLNGGADYVPFVSTVHQVEQLHHPDRYWTSFALDVSIGMSIASVSPVGGALSGGMRVTVLGTNFNQAIATQPECKFGAAGVVQASMVDLRTMVCDAPVVNSTQVVPVEVGLNGQAKDFTTAGGATFTYSQPPTLQSIYPAGGPVDGGTDITVVGSGFAELDHGRGLQCIFKALSGADAKEERIPATLQDGLGSIVRCASPSLLDLEKIDELHRSCSKEVTVRVTNNRGDLTTAESADFLYY